MAKRSQDSQGNTRMANPIPEPQKGEILCAPNSFGTANGSWLQAPEKLLPQFPRYIGYQKLMDEVATLPRVHMQHFTAQIQTIPRTWRWLLKAPRHSWMLSWLSKAGLAPKTKPQDLSLKSQSQCGK